MTPLDPRVAIPGRHVHGKLVFAGEIVIVTPSGRRVAELRPLPRAALNASSLVARWQLVPVVDRADLRRDLDSSITPAV
ncbi:MAG: type II toxin-antitoxin system prevent-host-death family antitoxin [Acidimicrobiia bacterium]